MRYTLKRRRRNRMTQRAGKAGKLSRIFYLDDANVLGAGSFGIVVSSPRSTLKLLYDIRACKELRTEALLQQRAYNLLKDIPLVHVPKVHGFYSNQVEYRLKSYLCGIEMDRVPIPEGFHDQVHMLLGYDQPDIDTVWSKDYRNPVGPDNPPRGYFAGPEMLEAIWEDEGVDLTIEQIAYTMGLSYGTLIAGGIIPMDVEWLYGGNGKLYMIDFGLCEFESVDPLRFLHGKSSRTLHIDYYIPKYGMRGYDLFVKGYMEAVHMISDRQ